MSKVKIQGHASGTGVLTVTAPNTSTDRTITLPDATGTLLDENSSLPSANLTGTIAGARLPDPLPAIDGSSLTGLSAVQIEKSITTSWHSTTTTVPSDNSTFTSSHGSQIHAITLTPTTISSEILVMAWANLGHSGATTSQIGIFKDAETGAKSVAFNMDSQGNNVISPTTWAVWFETSGSLTARTYKMRFGPNAGTGYTSHRGAAQIKTPQTNGMFAIEFA